MVSRFPGGEMNQNQTTTNTNTINTSATNASSILNGNDGKQQNQSSGKILECLEAKLDLILANQNRLEQLLSAQGALAFTQNTSSNQQASINA
jgi:hypothetical protein